MYSYTQSSAPVKSVQFGVLNPDDIVGSSVVEIRSHHFGAYVPSEGTIFDVRLGAVDERTPCITCGENKLNCPGHFGHFPLHVPVFHPEYFSTVLRILRCTCFHCQCVIATVDDPEIVLANHLEPKERLRVISKAIASRRQCKLSTDYWILDECHEEYSEVGKSFTGCSEAIPTIKRGLPGTYSVIADFSNCPNLDNVKNNKQELTSEEVHAKLTKITSEDCHFLGLNPEYARPDWMMISVLPIPPINLRPGFEDDLSIQLSEIIRFSAALANHNNSAPSTINDYKSLLQYHVSTYINNTIPDFKPATCDYGRPLKSLTERLAGKEGRIRANLMGKRVNFSARTVISPDPNLSIDQVGVPQSIAMNVTYPETVNSLNITRLQKLVHNGPFKYPGTKAVTRNDGVRMEIIRCSERNISLEIGFIVERHLLNEDIVVLNHQPAAFKSSLMAHRVKVWGYSTFALNPSVVGSYDADFDGDEMNMHVPQTLTTQTEAKELMMVSKQMISSISSKPIVGFVQDALLGAYLLTRRDTFLEKEEFMNLLMWVNTWDGKIPQPAVLKPKPLWTGKQVFSLLIPQDISLKTRNSLVSESSSTISDKFSSAENSSVIIDQGNLIVGSLDRRILGSTNNSLVQTILKEKGAESTKQFIDQTQGLLNHWLVQRGFSVSISDLIIDPKTQSQIRKTIDDSIVDYFSLREFESRAIRILAIARDSTGHEVLKCLDDHNNFRSMINAGSKGSLINITQMISCLGQQSISGSRIPLGFQDRALPHYTKFDQCAEARGFVKNSFFIGLRPAEFFFHAMETREGLLEAESNMLANAKIRRILVKNMEDIIVSYDGTVRNSMGQVVQFLYGEDGLDGTFMETQSFPSLKFSNQEMKNNYEFDWNHKGFKNSVSESVYNSLKNASDVQEILKGEIQQLFEDRDFLRFCTDKFRTQMCVPVNIRRLIKKAKKLKLHPINTSVKSDLDPIYVIEQIKKMTEKDLFLVHSHKGDQTFMETNKDATMLFNILLRSTLSSKQVIYHHKLNRQAFDWILQEIRFRFQQSKVHAGEAVGVAAAMSLRELGSPPMIMGFYSGTITHSLPTCRFKELILQFGEFSPWASMEIFPSGNDSHDITNMKSLACQLEYTTLRDLCSLTEIWYDPLIDITKTSVPEDRDLVEDFYAIVDDVPKLASWVLRFELVPDFMVERNITMSHLVETLSQKFSPGQLYYECSHEAHIHRTLRIRLVCADENPESIEHLESLRAIEQRLLDFSVCGVENIRKVFISSTSANMFDQNTGEHKVEYFHVLKTEGSNLSAVLMQPGVDPVRSVSNNIVEINQVLGIEAARRILSQEIQNIFSLHGAWVNYRHVATLVDTITHRGHLQPLTERLNRGVLLDCSFKDTVDVLFNAATFAERDNMDSISANIILGQLASFGTGLFDLYYNSTLGKFEYS